MLIHHDLEISRFYLICSDCDYTWDFPIDRPITVCDVWIIQGMHNDELNGEK